MTLQEAFENFIMSRRLKGLATKSITDYKDFITPFITYCTSTCEIEKLNRKQVDNYLLHLYEKERSIATMATYIRNTKIFLRWLESEYQISVSAKTIAVPKTPKKLVKIYSDDEINIIYRSIKAENPWLTARNRAMVFLMLDSGLRQNELCTLICNEVDFDNLTLKVHGKGNKERLTYLGKMSALLLKQYIDLCPYESKYMFVGRHGQKVTPDAVKHMAYRIANKLSFEFSSHKLRHNFATNYCIDQYNKYGRVDIYMLMNLMGHEDLKTTQRYLHHAMSILSATNNCSHIDNIKLTI